MQIIKKAIENGFDEGYAVQQRLHVLNWEVNKLNDNIVIVKGVLERTLSNVERDLLQNVIVYYEKLKVSKNGSIKFIEAHYIENKGYKDDVTCETINRFVKCEDIIQQEVVLKSVGRLLFSSPLKTEKEATPSFWVYKETNSWYDFSLGEGGDVIHLYERLFNVSFQEAKKELGKLCTSKFM